MRVVLLLRDQALEPSICESCIKMMSLYRILKAHREDLGVTEKGKRAGKTKKTIIEAVSLAVFCDNTIPS